MKIFVGETGKFSVSVEQVMKESETTKDFKRELAVEMCIWMLIV